MFSGLICPTKYRLRCKALTTGCLSLIILWNLNRRLIPSPHTRCETENYLQAASPKRQHRKSYKAGSPSKLVEYKHPHYDHLIKKPYQKPYYIVQQFRKKHSRTEFSVSVIQSKKPTYFKFRYILLGQIAKATLKNTDTIRNCRLNSKFNNVRTKRLIPHQFPVRRVLENCYRL